MLYTIPALHDFKFRTLIDLHERLRLAFVHYRSRSFRIIHYCSFSYFFNFCYLFFLIKKIYKIFIKIRISLAKVLVWKYCSAPSKRYHSIYNLIKVIKLGIKQYAISCICWIHHRLISLLSFFSVLHWHSWIKWNLMGIKSLQMK